MTLDIGQAAASLARDASPRVILLGMRGQVSASSFSRGHLGVSSKLQQAYRPLPNNKRQRVLTNTHGASETIQELLIDATYRQPDPLATTQSVGLSCGLNDAVVFEGCEPNCTSSLRVAVLLSGGVDSSLALHLVRSAGHHVTAFYLQIWFQEDFRNFWGACPWEEDLDFCKQVCEAEGVPLHAVPFTDEYWEAVVADSIGEIKQGRTPNPDMLCNSRVKFGAFYDFLEREHGGQFDRVATGHYAHVTHPEDGSPAVLSLTPDVVKDQTYFLAHLTQQQLARAMFPLRNLTKAGVRRLAAVAGLPTQDRRDSQGICFLGKVRFEEFVRQHLGRWPGPLVDQETGRVVGFHDGYWFYTPGQRKGILLSGGPWYVARKDCRRNVVYISRQYFIPEKHRRMFRCGKFSWLSGTAPAGAQMQCKTRHGPLMYQCSLRMCETRETAVVSLDADDQGLAPGQYAVFYQDRVCLGAAIIIEALQTPDTEEPLMIKAALQQN